jgi:hypothetical protein
MAHIASRNNRGDCNLLLVSLLNFEFDLHGCVVLVDRNAEKHEKQTMWQLCGKYFVE